VQQEEQPSKLKERCDRNAFPRSPLRNCYRRLSSPRFKKQPLPTSRPRKNRVSDLLSYFGPALFSPGCPLDHVPFFYIFSSYLMNQALRGGWACCSRPSLIERTPRLEAAPAFPRLAAGQLDYPREFVTPRFAQPFPGPDGGGCRTPHDTQFAALPSVEKRGSSLFYPLRLHPSPLHFLSR